jgi:hypothetical protein
MPPEVKIPIMMAGFKGKNRRLYPDNRFHAVPCYLDDLNAMHDAEMLLTEKQFQDYTFNLFKLFHGEENGNTADFPSNRTVMCATASQRAEAFVLTLDKN